LPPASLLRARTVGQIVVLLADQMGTKISSKVPVLSAARVIAPASTSSDDVNLEALSNEEIDALLGADATFDGAPDPEGVTL
jgi:hypothetical protein